MEEPCSVCDALSLSVSLAEADLGILASVLLPVGECQFRKLEVLYDVKQHLLTHEYTCRHIHRHTLMHARAYMLPR